MEMRFFPWLKKQARRFRRACDVSAYSDLPSELLLEELVSPEGDL